MIKIKVTKTDIKKGKQKNAYKCPVALAVARTFNVLLTTTVLFSSHVYFQNFVLKLNHSRAAIRAIKKFDNTGKMEPFNFMVEEQ